MTLRRLSDLGMEVGQPIKDAIRAIETRGGRHTHDSGHKNSPTWIYTFPENANAQLALRINKGKVSVYVRASPSGRADFERRATAWSDLEQHYPNAEGEKPANSLLSEEHARGLTPLRHRLLRLRVRDGQFDALLDAYLGLSPAAAAVAEAPEVQATQPPPGEPRSRTMTPDQLRQQLDRRDAIGRAGERIAYLEEMARLQALGCPDPAACVQRVSEANIAAGYDLRSEWNGERRHIEVKTTACGSDEIYLSENERTTLERLGDEAWLYRVELTDDEAGRVTLRLQNPVAQLEAERFRTAVWQVSLAGLRWGSAIEGDASSI